MILQTKRTQIMIKIFLYRLYCTVNNGADTVFYIFSHHRRLRPSNNQLA